MTPMGAADYRDAARHRIEDARRLRETERWVGAIYLAGRAVESMLRCLIWLKTRASTEGHDLRLLLKRGRELNVIAVHDDSILDGINEIAVLWHNNLRFYGDATYGRFLRDLRRDRTDMDGRKIRGDPIKANGITFLEICERIVAHGDLIWKRLNTKSGGSSKRT